MAKKKTIELHDLNPAQAAYKALELAEANAKAIQDLNDKIQKTFLEYSHTLATLKDRNRLR